VPGPDATWLHCWPQCNTEGSELIIIHNDNGDGQPIKKMCEAAGIKYIQRKNVGFDIGAFQDVCRGRLDGFPKQWDSLLWCTDDTIPMKKDFIDPFVNALQDKTVGIAAMKISNSVAPHVRTTGFAIKQSVAAKIQFPADPITTKSQCYFFEHRGGIKTLTMQVRSMGLKCDQVAPDPASPLFDTGYWRRLNRMGEHESVFNTGNVVGDKITFICTIYNTYPQIISSLLLQTHKNWELILIHDGQAPDSVKSIIPEDPRIRFIETPERLGNYGHPNRAWALEEIRQGRLTKTDYINVGNADNYYVPVFCEYMLNGFRRSHTAVATYCTEMVHSYKAWQVIPVTTARGFMDCAGVLLKADIAAEIGWQDVVSHSADWLFFQDIASRYSFSNFIPVKGCLFIHN